MSGPDGRLPVLARPGPSPVGPVTDILGVGQPGPEDPYGPTDAPRQPFWLSLPLSASTRTGRFGIRPIEGRIPGRAYGTRIAGSTGESRTMNGCRDGGESLSKVVWETKETLDGRSLKFPCQLVAISAGVEAVLRFETPREWHVERPAIVVPAGYYSYGYFWRDRSINAYHWVRRDGTSLGVYFNVATDTRISHDAVVWRDLVLDYWVGGDGLTAFLDEEDLPADLAPPLAAIIADARDLLVQDGRRLAREISVRTAGYWIGPSSSSGG